MLVSGFAFCFCFVFLHVKNTDVLLLSMFVVVNTFQIHKCTFNTFVVVQVFKLDVA